MIRVQGRLEGQLLVTTMARATAWRGESKWQPSEWDAECYHKICQPQLCWGLRLIDDLGMKGHETVLDAGCGSGKLTAALLERLSTGRVLAVDRSENMLRAAEVHLGPPCASRVSYLLADLASLPVRETVDLVFSAATFHWVHNHEQLFATLLRVLKPGGRLVAQCGGGENIARLRHHLSVLYRSQPYSDYFGDWQEPWYFTGEEDASKRLREVGFTDIQVWLAPAPFQFQTAAAYREFLGAVLLRAHLGHLPTASCRERFLDDLTQLSAQEPQPFVLDFWRLNLRGRRRWTAEVPEEIKEASKYRSS